MEIKFCEFCGNKVAVDAVVCIHCGRQLKSVEKVEKKVQGSKDNKNTNEENKFYTQTWFMWLMLIFFAPVGIFLMWKFNDKMKKDIKIILTIVFAIFFLISWSGDETTTDSKNSVRENKVSEVSKVKVEVIDFSGMQEDEILNWCNEKKLNCSFKKEYSDTIAKDSYIEQSVKATEQVVEGSKITITHSLGKEPTTEQKNALKKAENYARLLNMSKARIYKQLTSQYGEAFDEDAAQYAIDNIECDWNENALKKAKSYRDTLSMSKDRIYNQLTSQYGEQFTAEEAQYAIDHLDD